MKRFVFMTATLFLASCATAHQEQSAGHERSAKKGSMTASANSHGDKSDHVVRGQIFLECLVVWPGRFWIRIGMIESVPPRSVSTAAPVAVVMSILTGQGMRVIWTRELP